MLIKYLLLLHYTYVHILYYEVIMLLCVCMFANMLGVCMYIGMHIYAGRHA